MAMSCNLCQLMYCWLSDEDYNQSHSNQNQCLYPYPSGVLNPKQFSLGVISRQTINSGNIFQIEFRILSPIKLSIESSRNCKLFNDIFNTKKLNIYAKHENKYELNIKHFVYVFSRIKDYQEEGFVTFSYNLIDRHFINGLIKNSDLNDNIMSFIYSDNQSKKSIIESLKYDKQFGKSAELFCKSNLFIDNILYDNQLEAFFIGIMRNGKCILADETGKSLESIIIMNHFKKDWPLIIVCRDERKTYWSQQLDKWLPERDKFIINIIKKSEDIYTFPNRFHDIIIISYDLYYRVKDTISFKLLNIKSYIFEDQSRGKETHSRQWKGLSKCFQNLNKAKRICFIWSKGLNFQNMYRIFPILYILDSITFSDFEKFNERYCEQNDSKPELNRKTIMCELQILLRATVLIKSMTINDHK